jgi:hypothetical protein
MRPVLVMLAMGSSGCTAIGGGAISSVNLTVGEDISYSQGGYTAVLIGCALLDITILVLVATGEMDLALHERELDTDLARGDGRFVSDLASALALPASEVPRLGEVLRRHRGAIMGAIRQSAAAAERALALRAAIENALAEAPSLAARLLATRATRGQTPSAFDSRSR